MKMLLQLQYPSLFMSFNKVKYFRVSRSKTRKAIEEWEKMITWNKKERTIKQLTTALRIISTLFVTSAFIASFLHRLF